jgi:Haem-binding domain
MMKKNSVTLSLTGSFLAFCLFIFTFQASGQSSVTDITALPDSVSKIVTASCISCHSSQGKLMAKAKLNFSEWSKYSPEKQKERAQKMVIELDKGKMPPKEAREKRPDLIPTTEQIKVIKNWADSFRVITQ